MMKKLGETLFLFFIGWCIWVFIGANPTQRMQRACTSISGPGHLLAALSSAAGTDFGAPVQRGTDDGTYRCELTLWNFFYADAWKKAHPNQPLPGLQRGGFESAHPYAQEQAQAASQAGPALIAPPAQQAASAPAQVQTPAPPARR
jgi:hypothetical protein